VVRPKSAEKGWLRRRAEVFLRDVGVACGTRVLDFGCGEGNYTIPAARIAGKRGRVYAVDKDRKKLSRTMLVVKKQGLGNVVPLHKVAGRQIPVRARSIDVVLLYDVLHRGYLPDRRQRTAALQEVFRVLKPGGILSCYPTHLKEYGMTFERLLSEVRQTGFRFRGEDRKTLVHDGHMARGRVLQFVRPRGRDR
jgi:ubiquinone/menaquinone biosynthesis C-methylase UbiE